MKGLLCTNKFHGWKPLQLASNKPGFTFEHSTMNIEEDFLWTSFLLKLAKYTME
jgi:hypothetical protein